jgi:hypothetical protein
MKNPSNPTGNQTRELPTAPSRDFLERRGSQIIAHVFLCCYLTGLGVSMITVESIVLLIWSFLCANGGPEVKRISQQTAHFKNNTATH